MGRFSNNAAKSTANNTAQVKSIKHITFALLLSVFIASCGGGSGPSDDGQTSTGTGNGSGSGTGNGNQDPTDPVVTSPTIVAFDYQPQAQNRQYRSTQVQAASVTNSTGQFRLPVAGQNLTGNITVAVDVEDPDGIQNVYVGFSGATTAVELCASDCGTSFHKVITGLNPLDFNLGSGSPRLELWSLDTLGTKLPISSVEFNWQATFINGLNIARSNNQIDVDWNGLSNYLRYNVYIATQPGVTANNYQTLPDGEAFLAIRDPAYVINGKDNAKTFYTAVTGVDGSGESAFSQDIMVAALNGDIDLPPTATDDIYSMDEDTTLIQNVTDNDTDAESQILTISPTLISSPINGEVVIQANGEINYTPEPNFTGTDHFSYQVIDGQDNTDNATVIIQINQTNDAPESSYNTYNIITAQNRASNANNQRLADMTVDAPGLLINDIDIDSNNITVDTTPVTQPTQGSVVINADGSFTYTNDDGATGEDLFTYRTLDGNTPGPETTVRITIDGSSFHPIAASDRYTIAQDQTLNADGSTQARASLLNNDTDFDTDSGFTFRMSRDAARGFAVINPNDGTFTYIPDAGFYGIDSFRYEVADPEGNTAEAGVLITVEKQNNPPTASPDSYIFDEDTNFTANVANGLTSNDIDVDLDNFDIAVDPVTPPSNGIVTLSTDGSFTYIPTANFAGADTFTYLLDDNNGGTSIGQVTLTIANVNDNPVAQNDNQQTLVDTPINLDVLANDSDVENDPLTIASASATNGTVINNTTNLDYTPASGFSGNVEISYTIGDGQGGSASATVFLAVTINNPEPIAVDDSYAGVEDQPLIISAANGLLNNDSDQNGDTLTVNQTVFTPPSNGAVTLSTDGSFTYTPALNTFGTDSFVYQLLDGNGGSATATVNLTIASVNDDPQAVDDNFTGAEETLINLNVLANDSDVENDPLTIASASSSNATVTIQNDNTLNYTPNLNFFGADTISYTISDGNGGVATATAIIDVQNVNDNPVAANDNTTTDENTPVTINVLINDSDIDGDTLSVLNASSLQGTTTINGDSSITFTPTSGFNGSTTINYILSDGNGGNDTAIVSVTVNAVNDNPIALDDNAIANEDIAIDIDVLINDSDIDGDQLSIINPSAANGNVTVNSNNTLNYLADANFNGTDTINYTVIDGNGGQDSAIVNITINPINDNPTAVNDAIVINEDNGVIINVLANDFDIDNNQSELQVSQANANNGAVSVLPDNTLSYQPGSNFVGTDFINYTISDNAGGSASATVTVTVNSQNDLPIAINDTFTTDEDVAITLDVLANDTDADNDQLSITSATPSSGTINNTGTALNFQGANNFNGTVTINYTITDGQGGSASAIATVTVNAVNDLPIAINDSATTAEDTPVSIDVLANDSDVETAQLTVSTATAANGQVSNNAGVLVYTPTPQFNGNDTINYTIIDNDGGSASAIVNVTVTATNDLPIANADTATLDEDTTVSISPLANDTDPDGDTLTIASATASNGSVINNGQTLSYSPNANYNGFDAINYTISDGQGGSASSTISITVTSVNDLPVAVNDSATIDEDTQTIINVLANDSDADGDTLVVSAATASQGTVFVLTDQTLSYQPNDNFNGTDTINYTISDDQGGTANSTVTLSVTPINDNPIAVSDSATTDEDIAVVINALTNDTDADSDTLSIASATANNGSATISNGLTITYTPNGNFNGSDVIEYTISDNQGGSANATINVTVNAINDLPIAVNDNATTDEDTATLIDVLANDTDADTDILTISAFSATSGTVVISNNQLSYTPTDNFNGFDAINYTISDGQGGTAAAQVFVTVNAINDLPIAVNDTATTDEDISALIDVLSNDSDADGDILTVSNASALQGSVQALSNNELSYAPNSNFNGIDTINYIITDSQGGTASASVTVTVNDINDLPVLVADNSNTDEDTTVLIDALTNDTDVDGDVLTISAATASNGTATISNNQISYSPNENFNGSDVISYDVNDGRGGNAQSTIAVTIIAVNDIPVAVSDTATGDEDTSISVNVLANDTDIDNDALTISQASSTDSAGTVTVNGSNIDYQPSDNFNGLTTINYTVSDNNGGEASSSATVTVVAINDAPIASDDTASIDEDTSSGLNVLLNDSDVDGDSLTIQSATASSGDVTISSDLLTLSYVPNQHFNGTDTIAYVISDGELTASANVTVNVTAINDLPEPQADTASTDEDVNILIDVLANDTDPENHTLTIDSASANNGTTAIENGQIKYAPNNNYNGTDTITYQISDGNGGVASSTVAVNITAINDNPVAVADSAQTDEDIAISIDALANDSDPDGDTITIESTVASNGTVFVDTAGLIDYTPNANYNGTDTISYTISDGELTASNTITVSIGDINDAPKAADDEVSTNEDTVITIDALANDSDDDGDTITLDTATASIGSVTIIQQQLFYTPSVNFSGQDTISYQISDTIGATATGTVTVNINSINDAPEALNDSATTQEDTPTTIDVLVNDSDVDGDNLSISVVTADNGSVTVNVDSSLQYTPNSNFNGTDTIHYTIIDRPQTSNGLTASATVTVNVSAVNDLPVAVNDSATTDEDQSVTIDALANDTDIDGDSLSYTDASAGFGSVSKTTAGLVYTPDADFNGQDSIAYTISDLQGGTAQGTVAVIINPINDAPTAVDDTITTNEDILTYIYPLDNDTDIDTDKTITLKTATAGNGSINISGDAIEYQPNADYYGSDTISYTIEDNSGATATANIAVTINAVNDNPITAADSATTDEDTDILIDALANDSDPDGDNLTIKTANAVNGQTSILSTGIDYIPNADFNGTDTINYIVEDGFGGSSVNNVTVTVNPVNDAPVAVADNVNTDEDTPITINAISNDTDIDGDTLSITGATESNGSLSVNSDNSIDYTPDSNFNGTDTINYTLFDGTTTAQGTVTVTVNPINDNPVAVADTATTTEDIGLSIDVLANDTDADNDNLTIKTATSSDGQSVISAGLLIYSPNTNFNGTDVITYAIEDGNGGTSISTATVTVTAVNDAPVADDDTATTDEDILVNIDPMKNDGDIDGDTINIQAGSASADNGTIVIKENNTIDYTPSSNYNGSDTITYTITDGELTDTGSITVTINAINDDPDAVDDTAITDEDVLVNINVLSNDSDPDGNLLTVTNPSAANGSMAVQSDQSIDYTPDANFNGSDTITYTVSNATNSTTANVTVTVNSVNDSPVVTDETTSINENIPNGTSVVTMSATDIDLADNNSTEALTFNIQTNSANIFAIDSNTGLITVTDNSSLNFESAIRHDIVVKVDDTNGGTDTASVTINVGNVEETATPTVDVSFATSYGAAGTAASNALSPGEYTFVGDAKLDDDGRLVVVGRSGYSGTSVDFFIARFTTAGHLDRTFGNQGLVIKDLGNEETAYAVNFDASNNIIVAGTQYSGGAFGATNYTFIARYTEAGALDTSFDSDGYVIANDGDVTGIAGIEFDGTDIYVGTSNYTVVAAISGEQKVASSNGFTLLKYDSTGNEVTTAAHAFEGEQDFASALLKQSDGKLLIVGQNTSSSEYINFAAARFDISSGVSVDSSYGNSGGVSIDLGDSMDDQVYDAAINSNDDIYIVGSKYFDSSAYYTDAGVIKIDNTGALVSSFGNNGILELDADLDGGGYGDESLAKSIALDNSGNLYLGIQIGDSNPDAAIYKTNANGVVQTDYGNTGKFDIDIENSNDDMTKVLIHNDNGDEKVIFASTADPDVEPDLIIARLTTAGAFDNTYSLNGYNRVDTGFSIDLMHEIIELTASPNAGKFAAIGVVSSGGGNKLIAARYNANGSIDENFGQNGYFILQGVEADFNGEDIVEQSDGKLVIAGHQDATGMIIRLDTDGQLDSSFSTSGVYMFSPGMQNRLDAIAIDGNNNIVAGGLVNNSGYDALLIRLDSSGLLDSTFNASGIASVDLGLAETIEDIAITSNNDIITVGKKDGNALVIKVTNAGTLDTSGFGAPDGGSFDGYLSIDLDTVASSNDDTLRRVKILSDGSIIAAGDSNDASPIATVVKLTSAGLLDTSFDSDGIAQFNFGTAGSQINGLDLDASERIVISGYNSNGTDNDILLARISADGSPDTLFNTTGGKLWDYSGAESANAVFVRSDGSIIIGGSDDLGLFPTDFFFIQKILLVEP